MESKFDEHEKLRLNAERGEVSRGGKSIQLQGDVLGLLVLLSENPGVRLTRDELRDRLWPGDTTRRRKDVERLVHDARRLIEQHPSGPAHLKTVDGGYMLLGVAYEGTARKPGDTLSAPVAPILASGIGAAGADVQFAADPDVRAGSAASSSVDPTHEIWYRAIQRIYRNAMVDHIRSSLTEAHGAEATARLKKIFGKDWESIESDALAARETHEIESPIADSYDLLGVNHFHGVLAAHLTELAPGVAGKSPETIQRVRSQALEFANTVTTVRHPLSHPAAAPLSYEDAFRTIDAARRLLEICGRPEALDLQVLLDQLRWADISSTLPAPRATPLEDRLPPRERVALDFVGRKKELQELVQWLQDGRTMHWALVGEGGKGKTALAYEFGLAAKTRAPNPLSIVLWITAKRRRFELGQVFDEAPDFWTLDSELDALLKQYGWVEHLTDPVEVKKQKVLSLLTEFPALLIVDDIDSLAAVDEEAIQFLTIDVGRTPSRVLMTIRRRIFGLGHLVTEVKGLEGPEAEAFISSRIRLFNLDPENFGPKRRLRVVEVTEGSPLYMEDLLRLCAAMPPEDAIERWAEKRGDPARAYALQREFELLDTAAKAVLLAAALFDGPVTLPELQAITAMDDDALDGAIRALQDLYLFPKPRLIQTVDRFDVNLNVRTLVRRTMANSELYAKVQNAAKAVKGEVERTRDEETRLDSYRRQAFALASRGKLLEAESTLLTGLREFPEAVELLDELGWVYKNWSPRPRLADARSNFRRATQLKTRNPHTYKQWADLEVSQLEWGEAARIMDMAMTVLPDDRGLIQFAGFVNSRWAQQPRMTKKWAFEKFELSSKLYWRALKGADSEDTISRCYWGLSINARLTRDMPTPVEGLARTKAILTSVMRQWLKAIPVDPRRDEELRFIKAFWPGVTVATSDQ